MSAEAHRHPRAAERHAVADMAAAERHAEADIMAAGVIAAAVHANAPVQVAAGMSAVVEVEIGDRSRLQDRRAVRRISK